MDTRALRIQRKKLLTEAREISDKAEKEKRELTTEETTRWDTIFEDANKLLDKIEREETLQDEERRLAAREHDDDPPTDPTDPPDPDDGRGDGATLDRALIERLVARGWSPEMAGIPRRGSHIEAYNVAAREERKRYNTPEYRAGFEAFLTARPLPPEARAVQADDFAAGGSLVAPVLFQRDLIQAVDDLVYLRQWGTVRTLVGAQSAGYPSLDADPADADWTSELSTGSEDTSMATGGRELHPHPLAKLIKASQKLLRLDASAEGLVLDRLAYKFGVTLEKAGLTGTGAGQPLGVFTASADGISTDRDVSTGNTTTAPTMDGLKEAKYELKGQYWARAKWLWHRDVAKIVAKIKDSDGRYLWAESVRVGEPDRLLNIPAHMSEFAPNTLTTGLYVGILGDFSRYWWVDALGMQLQRLAELYAETNQIGFIGRLESDGMPVLEEAFVRVKLA